MYAAVPFSLLTKHRHLGRSIACTYSCDTGRHVVQAVADEVTSILDSGIDEKKLTDLKKGQPNIIMFVGLQARAAHATRAFARAAAGAQRCCTHLSSVREWACKGVGQDARGVVHSAPVF